jgi:hypothetical protein
VTETASAPLGFFCVSALRYRGAEDVCVVAVVIAPFEFSDIQRQIFATDFVEAAHDAAFQQRPKAIDRLSEDSTVYVLASAMPHNAVLFQVAISGMLVRGDQTNFFGNGFANEAVYGFCIGMFDNARHDIALALNSADNSILAFAAGPRRALIPMPIFVLAADICFIDFDDAHELAEFRFGEPRADAMAQIMSCRIGTETKHPLYLQRGNALLAGQYEIDDLEPCPHWNIGVFEDRAHQNREAITQWRAVSALPMKWFLRHFANIFVPATRATDALRPTPRNQVGFASIIGWKEPIELRDGHLFGELWADHRSARDV